MQALTLCFAAFLSLTHTQSDLDFDMNSGESTTLERMSLSVFTSSKTHTSASSPLHLCTYTHSL